MMLLSGCAPNPGGSDHILEVGDREMSADTVVVSAFITHDCSGTATLPGHHQHANATGAKVGLELATDGI